MAINKELTQALFNPYKRAALTGLGRQTTAQTNLLRQGKIAPPVYREMTRVAGKEYGETLSKGFAPAVTAGLNYDLAMRKLGLTQKQMEEEADAAKWSGILQTIGTGISLADLLFGEEGKSLVDSIGDIFGEGEATDVAEKVASTAGSSVVSDAIPAVSTALSTPAVVGTGAPLTGTGSMTYSLTGAPTTATKYSLGVAAPSVTAPTAAVSTAASATELSGLTGGMGGETLTSGGLSSGALLPVLPFAFGLSQSKKYPEHMQPDHQLAAANYLLFPEEDATGEGKAWYDHYKGLGFRDEDILSVRSGSVGQQKALQALGAMNLAESVSAVSYKGKGDKALVKQYTSGEISGKSFEAKARRLKKLRRLLRRAGTPGPQSTVNQIQAREDLKKIFPVKSGEGIYAYLRRVKKYAGVK